MVGLKHLQRHLMLLSVTIGLLITCLYREGSSDGGLQASRARGAMPDLSGLAWVEENTFLAVHDAKNPDENDRPRVSLIQLPESLDGIIWKPVAIDWPPPLGPSGDLESIARIPGTNSFLLVESGECRLNGQPLRRIFLVEVRDEQLKMLSFTDMPASIKNVEGTAVARLGEQLIFVFAERAEGRPGTFISWAELQLQPLKLGVARQVQFKPTGFTGRFIRPVSAIETDSLARLYVASAFDPGDDNGPFRSVIWRIGQVKLDGANKAGVVIAARPERLATTDGFKIESLAMRERAQGKLEIFAGTDDENFGGTLRLISPQF